MENTCDYCGDEIIGDSVQEGDRSFCSQECADAAMEQSWDYFDASEFDHT